MPHKSSDVNISSRANLPSPGLVRSESPLSLAAESQVIRYRQEVFDILDGKDPRRMVIVGPCSIHDPGSALEYADKLSRLAGEVNSCSSCGSTSRNPAPRSAGKD